MFQSIEYTCNNNLKTHNKKKCYFFYTSFVFRQQVYQFNFYQCGLVFTEFIIHHLLLIKVMSKYFIKATLMNLTKHKALYKIGLEKKKWIKKRVVLNTDYLL